ncbi:hypothetical protein R1flu_020951 [Riccia fluitans]|uniref:Uncharacterized protein n=1 Tax=Riccia fluitans TaxID=41844 RepID=A0ABD1ZN00_9MARC
MVCYRTVENFAVAGKHKFRRNLPPMIIPRVSSEGETSPGVCGWSPPSSIKLLSAAYWKNLSSIDGCKHTVESRLEFPISSGNSREASFFTGSSCLSSDGSFSLYHLASLLTGNGKKVFLRLSLVATFLRKHLITSTRVVWEFKHGDSIRCVP